jgi:hypothetical protein
LECVWNFTKLYPTAFEFNEDYLVEIFGKLKVKFAKNKRFLFCVNFSLDHAYSGAFGTFLLNCERERVKMNLQETTLSLWIYLDQHKNKFRNVNYTPPFEIFGNTQSGLIFHKILTENSRRKFQVVCVQSSSSSIAFQNATFKCLGKSIFKMGRALCYFKGKN